MYKKKYFYSERMHLLNGSKVAVKTFIIIIIIKKTILNKYCTFELSIHQSVLKKCITFSQSVFVFNNDK